MNIYFLLTFLSKNFQRISPKVCTRSFNFNLKMQKLLWEGDPPSHILPRSGASRPRLLSPSISVDNLAPPPPEKIPAYGLGRSTVERSSLFLFHVPRRTAVHELR